MVEPPSERELDALAGRIVKTRAGYRCERCGRGGADGNGGVVLHCHHIYTRSIKRMKWLLLNLICLCQGCHHWWHEVAQGGEQWDWLVEKFGGERLRRLQMIKAQRGQKNPDLKLTKLYLDREWEKVCDGP